MTDGAVAPALQYGPDLGIVSWPEYLKARIDWGWRPSEFNAHTLTLIPDPENPETRISVCKRNGCDVRLNLGVLCTSCGSEWRTARATGASFDEWTQTPRVRRVLGTSCAVPRCQRTFSAWGLCASHASTYRTRRRAESASYTIEQWIVERAPQPFGALPKCLVGTCPADSTQPTGLCSDHKARYKEVLKRDRVTAQERSIVDWLSRETEPAFDGENTYASLTATPFELLPEPVRWEFLFVVQQRDLAKTALLAPILVRSTYLHLRRIGVKSLLDLEGFGGARQENDRNTRGMFNEWRRIIEDAHREWSGVDDRDPRIIMLRDIEVKAGSRNVSPLAQVDLRGIHLDWVLETVDAYIRHAPRGREKLLMVNRVWTVIDKTLRERGTPKARLGVTDMDAVVRAICDHWAHGKMQQRAIGVLEELLAFGRRDDLLHHLWSDVPARFAVDRSRHQPTGPKEPGAGQDEPFRFVPQPIVDWLMDHLPLLTRRTPYQTAEAQAMIFLQEQCGRRTGETVSLLDDCISYDSSGSPYLEWRQGKPPYARGVRLPIHQETHDAIRDWQSIKREHGVESKWLFPSSNFPRDDRHYDPSFLVARVKALVKLVIKNYPYEAAVEGAEGNLIHFDMTTIDPYSFRHAFAQRFADAEDADGHATTTPDVLQDYMGHKSFNTTMKYFTVTAKRRKKALQSITPRRLNLLGEPVVVDRERDGFTRIAVSLGHCTEPHNVSAGGHGCVLDHACESCPFFLVDPLERDHMAAKQHQLRIRLERAKVIDSPTHILEHYTARIADCQRIIDGIDRYVELLPDDERDEIEAALDRMADIRRRATTPRRIDLRSILKPKGEDDQ